MSLIDATTPFGSRVLRRLQEELIIWITTISSDGTPQPNPVWFLWDGTSLVIYSKPNAVKLHHIARHPTVALNFNTAADGEDVVVITGTAALDHDVPLAIDHPEYIAKYAAAIVDISMDNESFSKAYSQVIRVTPLKVRGF